MTQATQTIVEPQTTARVKASTTTTCLPPIAAAIEAAGQFIGPGRGWTGDNSLANEFFKGFYKTFSENPQAIVGLKAIATLDADTINQFLADNGFSLRMPELKAGEFATAATFLAALKWLQPGKKAEIQGVDGNLYPGFMLDDKSEAFLAKAEGNDGHPIICIPTKTGHQVLIVQDAGISERFQVNRENKSDYRGLVAATKFIQDQSNLEVYVGDYQGIFIPSVDYDEEVDISWLQNAKTFSETGEEFLISRALQQTKFKMNKEGAKVESAVAIGFTCTSVPRPKPNIVVNDNFFVVVLQDGIQVFSAYFTPKYWKEPVSVD